jgi:DNA-binding MarR family transcriptional regulator
MKPPKHQIEQFKSSDDYLRFVREVSPNADLNCVMLYGNIQRAHHYLQQLMERRMETVGLSWAKLRMMMNLLHSERHSDSGGLQPSELSARQDISRNTASALISGLEKDGLISRALHGKDRRKFIIQLTPAGRKLLLNQMDEQFLYVSRLFDALSERQRQTLLDLMMGLNTKLKEQTKQCRTETHQHQTV